MNAINGYWVFRSPIEPGETISEAGYMVPIVEVQRTHTTVLHNGRRETVFTVLHSGHLRCAEAAIFVGCEQTEWALQGHQRCETCNGTGFDRDEAKLYERCAQCHGRGWLPPQPAATPCTDVGDRC